MSSLGVVQGAEEEKRLAYCVRIVNHSELMPSKVLVQTTAKDEDDKRVCAERSCGEVHGTQRPPLPPLSRDTLSTNGVSLNHTCLLLCVIDVGRLGRLAVNGVDDVSHVLSRLFVVV